MKKTRPMLDAPPLPLAGEGWGGGSLREGRGNCFKDASAICHHIVIAETKDEEAVGLNRGRAPGIRLFGRIGKMLAAIQFDHQLSGVTDKVGDVVLDRDLTTKARAIQAVIP